MMNQVVARSTTLRIQRWGCDQWCRSACEMMEFVLKAMEFMLLVMDFMLRLRVICFDTDSDDCLY